MSMKRATGTFDVKLNPVAAYNTDDASMGRMSLDKQFSGDMQASSKGEMLSSMDRGKGSGAYVAIERVTGSVANRHGSFALYHVGTMDRGKPQLSITIVPDSGTDELTGITGSMTIEIDHGNHSYVFEYSLPEAAE